MKLLIAPTVFLALTLSGCHYPDQSAQSKLTVAGFHQIDDEAPDPIRRSWAQAAMIPIDSQDGYVGGSGIVYQVTDRMAFVLTNHHVSKEGCEEIGAQCRNLHVRFGYYWDDDKNGFETQEGWSGDFGVYENPVLAYDSPRRDMSVLAFDLGTNEETKFIDLDLVRNLDDIDQAEEVSALGFPLQSYRDEDAKDVPQVWSSGHVSGIAFDTQLGTAEGNFLAHSADLLPGMSGGGVFNSAGQLIAIQQSILRIDSSGDDYSYENIQFMVGVTFDEFDFEIDAFLDSYRASNETRSENLSKGP